jgi:hypothetical protein
LEPAQFVLRMSRGEQAPWGVDRRRVKVGPASDDYSKLSRPCSETSQLLSSEPCVDEARPIIRMRVGPGDGPCRAGFDAI